MVNDTISDVLTRIRNGCLIQSESVSIPLTRDSEQICQILEREGLIDSFQRESSSDSPRTLFNKKIVVRYKYKGPNRKSCITNLRRISKPGLRVYTSKNKIPTVLGGMGILILSTSQGIMTDREARFRGIGGEILCSVW